MTTRLLAADYKPIRVGDTLFGGDGTPWHVLSIHPETTHAVHAYTTDKVYTRRWPSHRELKAEWLTH